MAVYIIGLDPGLTTGYAVLRREGSSLSVCGSGVLGPYVRATAGMRGRERTRLAVAAALPALISPPYAVGLEQRREGMGAHSIPADGAWDAAVPFADAANGGRQWQGKPIGWFAPQQWQRCIGEITGMESRDLRNVTVCREACARLLGTMLPQVRGLNAPHIFDAVLIGAAMAYRLGWTPAGYVRPVTYQVPEDSYLMTKLRETMDKAARR